MPENYEIPEWACSNWGNYEHDWLDCPKCISKYEEYLDKEEYYERKFEENSNENDPKIAWKGEGF